MSTAALNRSISEWTSGGRRLAFVLYVLVVVGYATWLGPRIGGGIWDQPDSASYMNLAEGKPVMMPFASRQLGPLIVRGLSHGLHLSMRTAFVVEGTTALLIFVAVTAILLWLSGAPRWLAVALAVPLFWPTQYTGLVMPDLVYAALMCGFLLLLRQKRLLAAALMMLPMTVSRESTMLTLVCFLLAGWRRLRRHEVATALVAMGAGMALVKRLSANALPNYEHLPPTLYLIAKMPWNLLKNVFGLSVWANLYPSCEVPRWRVPLHVGPLRAVGYCGFNGEAVMVTFASGLFIFGLLPLLAVRLRRTSFASGGRDDVLPRFVLVYGGISFALAPLLGESVVRLYGYSWPLFLVGLPLLLGASRESFRTGWAAGLFLLLHLALTTSPLWMYTGWILVEAAVSYGLAWWLLRRHFGVAAASI